MMDSKGPFIAYGDEEIQYEVLYSPGRRTLGIEVLPDQRVIVRAPPQATLPLIAERLYKRARWISRQMEQFAQYSPRTPARQYLGGETHLYLGRQYRLVLTRAAYPAVKLSRGELHLALPDPNSADAVKAMLQEWYRSRARQVFAEVLAKSMQLFPRMKQPRLVIRALSTRWGSLSARGTMTLNQDLIRAPRQCIEYVITHELCHMKHRNHDSRFFKLLATQMPDWEKRKKRLEMALI